MISYFFGTIVPIFISLITSFPLNIIVLLSFFLTVVMYFTPDIFVRIIVIYWELERLFWNIQIAAFNSIKNIFYEIFAPFYNDGVFFIQSVIEVFFQSICQDATTFGRYAQCTGASSFIQIFKFGLIFLSQVFMGALAFFNLGSRLIIDLFCIDATNCGNICDTPTCSTWSSFKNNEFYSIENKYQNREFFKYNNEYNNTYNLQNPASPPLIKGKDSNLYWGDRLGPFGLDLKNYFGDFPNMVEIKRFNSFDPKGKIYSASETMRKSAYEFLHAAQWLGKILATGFQWFVEEVLPFVVEFFCFAFDCFKLLIAYFGKLLINILFIMVKIIGKGFFVLLVGIRDIITSSLNPDAPTPIVEWDFEYFRSNQSTMSYETLNRITDKVMNEYLTNSSNLLLLREDVPFNWFSRMVYLQIYNIFEIVLKILFEVPILTIHLIDKVVCLMTNIPYCLHIGSVCDTLFKPPVICATWVEYYEEDGKWEYAYPFASSLDVLRTINKGSGWEPCYIPGTHDTYLKTHICKDTYYFPGDGISFGYNSASGNCYNYRNGPEQAVKAVSINNEKLSTPQCLKPDPTPGSYSYQNCQFGDVGNIDLNYWGNYIYHPLNWWHHIAYYFYEYDSSRGILFFDKTSDASWNFFDSILDPLFSVWGTDFWSVMTKISFYFHSTCNDILGGECPCQACQADITQTLHYLDFIPGLEGWPCNPTHPNPLLKCCVESPYKSIFWYLDSFSEWLGIDIFNASTIVIKTP